MFIQCTRCGARTANVYGSGDPSEWADARHNWNQRLACYEAGSAAAAQAAWQPIATAPHGVRVLLGPREAPVVGIVKHPPEWEEERDPVCSVVHYNGNVFVAGYHCSEWMPLPAAPTQGAEGAAPQAVVREASEAVGAQIEALTALADTYVDAGITYQGNPNALTVATLDTARSAFINAARAALAQHQPQQGEAA